MSRCFPFPPPGYERKAGADNVDLLKQDKHREKKHKKEKRDKEKREGKEKKEKDRSDEKHRDKKEKKDKHRDKKDKQKEKEKEKERERDRSSTSSEKKLPECVGYINEEKVLDQKGVSTFPALQTGEKSIQKEKDKIKNSISDSKRTSFILGAHNAERVVPTNHVGVKDAKCIQELAKRLKSDHCSGSEQASAAPEQRKDSGKDQLLGKAPGAGLEVKERTKDRKNSNEQKMDERASREQSRLNGTMKVQDFGGAGQTKLQEGQLFGQAPGAGLEGKEMTKNRRHDNEQRVDEHVAREQSRLNGTVRVQDFGGAGQKKLLEIAKPSVVNAKEMEWREMILGNEGDKKRGDKVKVKESRKKEERAKVKSKQKHIDQEKLKAGNKNGVLGSPHLNSLHPVKESNRTIAAEENLKKRKEYETNGFLLGNEVRANKLHKQAHQGFQLPMENGMEPLQISTQLTPSRPELTNNNVKVKKINGVKGGAQTSSISSPLRDPPSSAAAQAELLSSSVKPPHPDSKFLSEILKVPKLDELPDLDDDHEWLFSCNKENFRKSKGGESSISEETPEVWGESLHMESADIYALPYVIPY